MNLPVNWEFAQISELAAAMFDGPFGSSLKSSDYVKEGVRLARLENIGRLRFRSELKSYVSQEKAAELARHTLRGEDILFSSFIDEDTRVCLVPKELDSQIVNKADCFCVRVDASACEAKYLAYRLLARSAYEALAGMVRGVTRPRIGLRDLARLEIELPPVPEQRRMVAKLDALSSRIARARAELGRVEVLADHLRGSGLRSAFDGSLIAGGKTGWREVRFESAGEIASNLVQPSTIAHLPHIAPNHIASGRPKLLPYRTIGEDEVISGKHRFFSGQILYSKIRPYLRKVALVDFEGGCSADMYPINPKCNGRYLMYWMLSPQFTWLASQHEGRTVLPKINQNALNAIPTPLPPENVQQAIADSLDAIFARADRLEAEAVRARKLLDRLEAAILAKAFRGELVPQDPYDEPASVLLERIRAARAAARKGKRGRRASA